MHHDVPLISTAAMAFVLACGFGFAAHWLRLPPLVGYLRRGHRRRSVHAGLRRRRGDGRPAGRNWRHPLDVRRRPAFLGGGSAGGAVGRGAGRHRPDRRRHQHGHRARAGLGLEPRGGAGLGLGLSVASTVVLLRALEDRNGLDTRQRPHRRRLADRRGSGRWSWPWCCCRRSPKRSGRPGGDAAGTSGGGNILVTLAITLLKVAAFIALAWCSGRRWCRGCSSRPPGPARASCSRSGSWRWPWASPTARRRCSGSRSRSAPSSPAWC